MTWLVPFSFLLFGSAVPAAEGRPCDAANEPRRSVVMQIQLDLEQAGTPLPSTRFRLFWKRIDEEEQRSLLRFQEPSDLENAALLMVLRPRRSPRVDLLLPEIGKPQRIRSRDQLEGFLGRAGLGIEEVSVLLDRSTLLRGDLLADDERVQGRPTWKIGAVATDDDARYPRTTSYIDQETCVPLQVDFQDDAGRSRKVLRTPLERIVRLEYLWHPRLLVFEEAGAKTRVTLRVDEIELDRTLPPDLLTRRGLRAANR